MHKFQFEQHQIFREYLYENGDLFLSEFIIYFIHFEYFYLTTNYINNENFKWVTSSILPISLRRLMNLKHYFMKNIPSIKIKIFQSPK